jgi:DNA-binding NtrC family response regulator
VNPRIVAATNQNLRKLTEESGFRADLFYRLNVVRLELPPLRERKEDLPLLIDHWLQRLKGRAGRPIDGLTGDAIDALIEYSWPGNIRELRNAIEAAIVTAGGRWISREQLPEPLRSDLEFRSVPSRSEKERVLSVLAATNWNKSRAADRLQWSRMTLYRKLKKLEIETPDSRS